MDKEVRFPLIGLQDALALIDGPVDPATLRYAAVIARTITKAYGLLSRASGDNTARLLDSVADHLTQGACYACVPGGSESIQA